MIGNKRRRSMMLGAVVTMLIVATAQTQRQSEALSIQGYPGQANVIRSRRACVRGRAGPGANRERLTQL